MDQFQTFVFYLGPVLSFVAIAYLFWVGRKLNKLADAYAEEKGKNLAMQEDVDSVLRLVEEMKTQVEVSGQAHVDTDRAERGSLQEFIGALMDFTLSAVPEAAAVSAQAIGSDGQDAPFDEKRLVMRNAYSRLMAAYSRAVMFCGEDELRAELTALAGDVATLHQKGLLAMATNVGIGMTDRDKQVEVIREVLVPQMLEMNELNEMIRQRYERLLHLGSKRLDNRIELTPPDAFKQQMAELPPVEPDGADG